MEITRRGLLGGSLATSLMAGLNASFPQIAHAAPKSKFRFAHLTDFHAQPELGAPDGISLALKKLMQLKPLPDFVVCGGDQIMDLLSVSSERADTQFKVFEKAIEPLEMPLYYTIGNHDVYGWGSTLSKRKEPGYGLSMFTERVSKRDPFYTFEADRWLFLVLNSIQPGTPGGWKAAIDDAQLSFMKSALVKHGTQLPVVVVSHVPIFSIFPQYNIGTTTAPTDKYLVANGKEVRELFAPYNIKAVLQGHTHVVENCTYLGTQYITSGAICGEWWKGPRLGVHPEGFSVFDVDGENLKWQYVPYGWKARV